MLEVDLRNRTRLSSTESAYRTREPPIMLHKLLYALALLSFMVAIGAQETEDVEVEFYPETVGGFDNTVELICKFKTNKVAIVDWLFRGEDASSSGTGVINLTPDNSTGTGVPKPGYEEKLSDIADITDTEQKMKMKVDWCKDLGYYDCYVADEDTNIRGKQSMAELKAEPKSGKLTLNGEDFDEDTRVDTPTGTVGCKGRWLNDQVSAELTDGTNNGAASTAALTGEDTCTYEAETTLDYTFNAAGEILTFECTVTIEGNKTEVETKKVFFQADPPTTTTTTTIATTTEDPSESKAVFHPVNVLMAMVALLISLAA